MCQSGWALQNKLTQTIQLTPSSLPRPTPPSNCQRCVWAAIMMILLPELAREFNEYRMLMFGALMVLMMIWRPQGLLPMQRPHLELKQ